MYSENSKIINQEKLLLDLDGFEGPIDLLLHLAKEQKVDLSSISILQLSDQYLNFIQNTQLIDIEIAADYLVMAAWLAYLKSRLLIPDIEEEENYEEILDVTEELKKRLQRLEAMQEAGKKLLALPKLGENRFKRGVENSINIKIKYNYESSLYQLLTVYGQIISNNKDQKLTVHASSLYSIQDALNRLNDMIGDMIEWTDLNNFLPKNLKKQLDLNSAIASHFVAALDLVNKGNLKIMQEKPFGTLWMKKINNN
tara:strand:+ start:374 stop:1138 length:765 start_codon:yes stop_codon:yes gene_type:complete